MYYDELESPHARAFKKYDEHRNRQMRGMFKRYYEATNEFACLRYMLNYNSNNHDRSGVSVK